MLEGFAGRFPHRFFNMGVAEQNMVAVATGLADAGFIPFVYSITPFASLRPYEFIRNGPIHHRLPVRIVGVGGGFEYGPAGPSHYALEDIGVLRVQPSLALIAPADHQQARTALLSTWDLQGPVYYRIGKDDETLVPGLEGNFELGRVQLVRHGQDMLLLTTGSIATEVAGAAELLHQIGLECTVAVVASLSPAPTADLSELLKRFRVAMTIEEHYLEGGVGSMVSAIIAEQGLACRLVRQGVKTAPGGASGSQQYLRALHGLSREALVEAAVLAAESITK